MTNYFSKELKNDNFFYSKATITLIIGIVLAIITYNTTSNQELGLLLFTISLVLIMMSIVFALVKQTLKFNGITLVIERSIFGFTKNKYFDIKRIQDLNYHKNVKSIIYQSRGKIRVLGMDATPESWKEYYYHKEVISFNYKGKKIEIGKWKKPFNGKQLVNLLKEKK